MKLGLVVFALFISIILISVLFPSRQHVPKIAPGACATTSCGAIHDVNNPEYNIHEVIKNTLLIEAHLAEKNKYCKSCIVKHYLISNAYLVEAIWMAGNKCSDYPKLEESLAFYENNFKQWYSNMDDDTTRVNVLNKLREWRRDMIQTYYFDRHAVL